MIDFQVTNLVINSPLYALSLAGGRHMFPLRLSHAASSTADASAGVAPSLRGLSTL